MTGVNVASPVTLNYYRLCSLCLKLADCKLQVKCCANVEKSL